MPDPERLWSPWRMDYIRRGGGEQADGCIFCDLPAAGEEQDEANHLLARGEVSVLLLNACSTFQRATEPVEPYPAAVSARVHVPDSVLSRAIERGELIVLATPVELASQHGFLTPRFQLGAKETWYDVKLVVHAVLKGKLKGAKHPDFGMLPPALTPPPSFGRLAANEIVVQYPAVMSRTSNWANAAPLVPGERAVFIFRRCYYCLQITGVAHARGPYYTANPLVALGGASKLPPGDLARVERLVDQHRR